MLIRPYDESRDREDVRDCCMSAFGRSLWPIWRYSALRAIDDIIFVDFKIGTVCLVAEIEGAARGVLVGGTSSGFQSSAREFSLQVPFLFRRFVSDRSAMRPLARASLLKAVVWELPYTLHSSRGKAAQLIDLAVTEGYRGGVGRALVDAFVEEARKSGLRRVDVGTDSELSWGFYERYGFRRVREFTTHVYDYSLPDRDVTGYIYSLDI